MYFPGNSDDKNEFYNNPKLYKSSFIDFAKHANIFIAAHYYSMDSPFLFTREDAKHPLYCWCRFNRTKW